MIQSLPRAASCYHSIQFLREPREAMRRRVDIKDASLMGLGKPGRLRVDQPTIIGELGPAPDAYTHYSARDDCRFVEDCRSERF